jgi:quinol-cytochrome oxidoreductase complex cytochrome b subunit
MSVGFGNWLDERIGWRKVWDAIFLRKIPKVNWFYTLGSATLFVALMQGITGILLTIYYVPTPDHAYNSVQFITTQVPGGWFVRGIHHWGASAMVPFIGEPILRIMRGGEDLSAVTLARFFGTHVWVLPTILLLLLGFHMYLVIRLGISAVPKREE